MLAAGEAAYEAQHQPTLQFGSNRGGRYSIHGLPREFVGAGQDDWTRRRQWVTDGTTSTSMSETAWDRIMVGQ